jgi:hypothetical protein|tara:strand:+ start:2747 stop:3217 length:471 start_codon:yes stop_codon:yes gene_type:complete
MYTLFSDKPNLFECTIQLEGASLSQASARLIIESDENSLVFEGEIDKNGVCLIPIKKLKSVVSENGNMKLEVIADDMYFNPWSSDYELTQSKKVTVEVKNPTEKPKLFESNKPKVNVTFKKPIKKQKVSRKTVSESKSKSTFTNKDLEKLLKRLRG